MPFKSEKQRRYLWATQPELAKRWAHEYPQKKKLPLYVKDKKEKAAHAQIKHLPNDINNLIAKTVWQMSELKMKTADSKQEHVVMPRSDKPTYAGEERAQGSISGGEIDSEPKAETNQPKKRENAINSLLQKISTVVAPAIRQRLEDAKAQAEGRLALKLPKNLGVKKYPVAAMGIPLPMGMTAQQPQQAQPQVRQPDNSPTSAPPVGKSGSPTANPIQSFGAISANNNLNGNAAFGAKNSPLSSKSAAVVLQAAITKWSGAPNLVK